jgi:hypothetical protein
MQGASKIPTDDDDQKTEHDRNLSSFPFSLPLLFHDLLLLVQRGWFFEASIFFS